MSVLEPEMTREKHEMMEVEESKETRKLSSLKGHLYDVTELGKQADKYMQTTKVIAEYVGQVYG